MLRKTPVPLHKVEPEAFEASMTTENVPLRIFSQYPQVPVSTTSQGLDRKGAFHGYIVHMYRSRVVS
jgi:hypothetical protein